MTIITKINFERCGGKTRIICRDILWEHFPMLVQVNYQLAIYSPCDQYLTVVLGKSVQK